MEKEILAVITGDVTMDWNLVRSGPVKRGHLTWNPADTTDITWQRGGAALLADLLEAVGTTLQAEKGILVSIRQPVVPTDRAEIIPGDPRFHHSFAIWSEKKYAEKAPLDKEKAWRVDEYMGLRRAEAPCLALTAADDPAQPDLIVLDDADLGFREAEACWPRAVRQADSPAAWILLKMAKPVAQGPLWEHLHHKLSKRLIVVTTVNDLRLTEVQISRELSWERTAQDLFWELVHNPCINALSHCAHVLVSFGAAGVVLLSRQASGGMKCSLFFDPRCIEGTWEAGYPGGFETQLLCPNNRYVNDEQILQTVATMLTRVGIQTRLQVDGEGSLSPQVEEGLYRIAQEALNNALKHARASSVTLQLHRGPRHVVLEIVDDGVGFDPAAGQSGFGLRSMAERTARLGGKLEIDSGPGRGTHVRVEVCP